MVFGSVPASSIRGGARSLHSCMVSKDPCCGLSGDEGTSAFSVEVVRYPCDHFSSVSGFTTPIRDSPYLDPTTPSNS